MFRKRHVRPRPVAKSVKSTIPVALQNFIDYMCRTNPNGVRKIAYSNGYPSPESLQDLKDFCRIFLGKYGIQGGLDELLEAHPDLELILNKYEKEKVEEKRIESPNLIKLNPEYTESFEVEKKPEPVIEEKKPDPITSKVEDIFAPVATTRNTKALNLIALLLIAMWLFIIFDFYGNKKLA